MPIPIEIFRTGRHVAMSGEVVEFSARDLAGVVASYDPVLHEAPIVLGHPADNAPAFGWVKSLRAKGGVLEAMVDQLEPSFSEAVKAGRYKKVSASFYRPDSPSNPKPGAYYLRHVGFLGAMPPAVKGLKQVEFAGSSKECLTVEFASSEFAGVFARLRAWIVKQFGEEAAEEALPRADLEAVVSTEAHTESAPAEVAEVKEEIVEGATEAAVEAVAEVVPELSDEQKAKLEEVIEEAVEEAVEKATADVSAPSPDTVSHSEPRRTRQGAPPRRPDLDRRERELAERERKLRRSEFAQFLEGLVRDGRPLPLKRDAILDLMEVLSSAGTISFGEGKTKAPLEVFKTILQKLPRRIHFAEFADGDGESGESTAVIARRAQAWQAEQLAKGIVVSTADAVRHVKGQR